MLLNLVSIADPSIKKTIEIPKEIVKNKTSVQSEVIKPVKEPAKSQKTKQPPETQTTSRKKSRQTSQSIIHG